MSSIMMDIFAIQRSDVKGQIGLLKDKKTDQHLTRSEKNKNVDFNVGHVMKYLKKEMKNASPDEKKEIFKFAREYKNEVLDGKVKGKFKQSVLTLFNKSDKQEANKIYEEMKKEIGSLSDPDKVKETKKTESKFKKIDKALKDLLIKLEDFIRVLTGGKTSIDTSRVKSKSEKAEKGSQDRVLKEHRIFSEALSQFQKKAITETQFLGNIKQLEQVVADAQKYGVDKEGIWKQSTIDALNSTLESARDYLANVQP